MTVHHFQSEAIELGSRMLRTALGPHVAGWLEDPSVVEVMLNPDGRLWVDRLGDGLADTGERLSAADGERIVRLVAHHVGAEVHAGAPRVSAELPRTGERFEGLLPPVVAAPAFAIRKPAVAVFTLENYVAGTGDFDVRVAGAQERRRDSVAGFEDALKVQAGVVGNIDGARAEMAALVSRSQSATGALQAAQAGNQILALQSAQIADLTAAIAAQNRAQSLEAARAASAEAQARENLARFLDYGSGYRPTRVRLFGE